MSLPTSILIIVAIAIVLAIAFFALRGRPNNAGVAASSQGGYAPPPADGEATIVGDVTPLGPVPTMTAPQRERKPSQVYEPPRPSEPPPRQSEQTQRQSELVEDRPTPRADIRWSKRFEPRDGAFDDATRLSLIRDLGIVRAPWGVPLLTQAYEEEPAVEHRRTALRALAAYRHPDTQPTFELALRADDEESRAIAANALTALSIRAALPS